MSTFLTQGHSAKQSTKATPEASNNNQNLQTSLLYAPFVKPTDKVKKDVAELSFTDFQPKRFALSYDPPVIILEYLVPSTGKLYHHKMKLRQLKYDSETDEMMEYLKKRHPLYFMSDKFNPKQITDLIDRLKFKLKQIQSTQKAKDKIAEQQISKMPATSQQTSKLEPLAPLSKQKTDFSVKGNELPALGSLQKQATNPFKSGSSLPTLNENDNKQSYGFGASNQYNDINKQFANMDFKDDFGDDFGDDDDEEEEDGDFDANELLNLTDYQNKRKQTQLSNTGSVKNQPSEKVGKDGAIEISHDGYYDEEEDEDEGNEWGDDWGNNQKEENLENFDYNNVNLNKLSTDQIAKHKKKMDEKFVVNQLKPGDKGFVYDKRIEFTKQEEKEENSWDEDVDDYFDDDYE